MRRLGAFVWVIVILVSVDAGLAFFCRSSCGFWQRAYVANDHRVSSEIYHHGLAPGLRVWEGWGLIRYGYATNSLGFKDAAPRAVDPGGGAYRVLFLGDSFTEGKGLDYRRSFVGRVARAWGKRGIEVLNAGVDSYSPVIYRLKLKHLVEAKGLRIDLCVVFLDVSDIYDEVRRYRVDSEGRLTVPPGEGNSGGIGRVLRDHSFTARLLPYAWDHLAFLGKAWKRRLRVARDTGTPVLDVDRLDMWIGSVTGLAASAWSYDDARWEAYGRAGRARAAANMSGLLRQLERLGVPLVLAVYPWPDQLFHDPKAPRHLEFWRDWSARRGVRFINLFPAFTAGDPSDSLERHFMPLDFHWNSDGHRLAARVFLESFEPGP